MITFVIRYSQQALCNLCATKLRTTLAASGILVGTAAIVALMSCSQLATEKALAQFKALGTDLIALSVTQQEIQASESGGNPISLQYWRALPTLIPDLLHIAPYNTTYQPVSFQGVNLNTTIFGADESLANVLHIQLAAGHFVSFLASYERYCVLGHDLALQLQQIHGGEPLGKQLQIGQALYTIIGIASPWKENNFFNGDINQAIIIPIAGMVLINKNAQINNAVLLLRPDSHIEEVIDQIKHAIQIYTPNMSIFIHSAKQIIASMENQGHIFTLLLAVIGGISLLVGGFGVMNVMLISVSERKKEIGVRKAIGANNREIQALFLIESIMLSVLGGLLGLMMGLLFTAVFAYFNQWPFLIYHLPLFIGFSVSVLSGIFFGFYPAYRAAQLEPIESLRSE